MSVEATQDPGLFDDDPQFGSPPPPEPVDVDAIIAQIRPPEDPYASDRDRESRKEQGNPNREKNPRGSESELDEVLQRSKSAAQAVVADIPAQKPARKTRSRRSGGRYRGTADFSDDPRLETGDPYPHYHGQDDFFPTAEQAARNHRGAAVGAALIKLNKDSRERHK